MIAFFICVPALPPIELVGQRAGPATNFSLFERAGELASCVYDRLAQLAGPQPTHHHAR